MAKKELEEIAKTYFIRDGLTQKEIARKINVSEQTLSRWSKKGFWDDLRRNIVNSKTERLNELYCELAALNKTIKNRTEGSRYATSKEADIRRKLIRDIADLEKKYNIAQTTVIARDYVIFCKDIDFDFAVKASDYFDAFIHNLINKQKWQE